MGDHSPGVITLLLYVSGLQLHALEAQWYAGVPAILRLHRLFIQCPHHVRLK